jgi:hypothetical protein
MRMEFGTLPRYSGGPDGGLQWDASLDRHSWEFGISALVVAMAIGCVVLLVFGLLILLVGVPAFPAMA